MSHSEADSSGAKAAEERQAKLMKQTQQISLLEESNMYLKQTAVVSEQKATELEEKVSGLEKNIKPIQEKLRAATAERDAAVSIESSRGGKGKYSCVDHMQVNTTDRPCNT